MTGQVGTTEDEFEVTQEMVEAGAAAFSMWVSTGEDEEAICEGPSHKSVGLLVSAIFSAMTTSKPESF